MLDRKKIRGQIRYGKVKFVIRNGNTGAYIHKSMLKILEFDSYSEAAAYIRKSKLSERIYFVEAQYE